MLLSDFETELDEKIVARGRAYYQDGNVRELKETAPGVYRAVVEGTDDYNVAIVLSQKGEIIDHDCDCPYEWGEYCKHEAAALFALRKLPQSAGKPEQPAKKPPKEDDLRQLIREMPREDLEALAFEAAERNQNLHSRIRMLYRQKPPTDAEIRRLILDGLCPYSRRGYVEYRDTGRALEGIDEALGIAGKQKSPVDTARIAMTIVNTLETIMNMVDDSDGYLGGHFQDCMERLRGALERAADAGERDKIFQIGIRQAEKTELWGGQRLEVLKVLAPFADDAEKRALVNGQLDEMARGKSEWATEEACLMRMSLMEQADPAQARRYLEAHVELPGFRKLALELAVEEGDFTRAEQLAREGIEQAQRLPGLKQQWRFAQADIANATGNLALERETLRQLCVADAKEAYPRLKALYPAAEWAAVRDSILDALSANLWSPALYPAILVQEGLLERLMAYCEQTPSRIFTYYPQLAGPYLERTDALFLRQLWEEAARANDRRAYQHLCGSVRVYAGALGAERALEQAQELRRQYARRPALLDELRKLEKALAQKEGKR